MICAKMEGRFQRRMNYLNHLACFLLLLLFVSIEVAWKCHMHIFGPMPTPVCNGKKNNPKKHFWHDTQFNFGDMPLQIFACFYFIKINQSSTFGFIEMHFHCDSVFIVVHQLWIIHFVFN